MGMPDSKYRKIVLSNVIDATNISAAVVSILEINADDDLKENDYKNWERKPIQLFINSAGGSVYDGLALVDVIKQSKTPVHTVVVGSAMSMGFWIYLAGHERYVGENATLMYHDITSFAIDKTEGLKQTLEETLRLQKILNSEITSTSLVSEDTLQDFITRKAEWFIPAAEAIKLKLANGYYKYY